LFDFNAKDRAANRALTKTSSLVHPAKNKKIFHLEYF